MVLGALVEEKRKGRASLALTIAFGMQDIQEICSVDFVSSLDREKHS